MFPSRPFGWVLKNPRVKIIILNPPSFIDSIKNDVDYIWLGNLTDVACWLGKLIIIF